MSFLRWTPSLLGFPLGGWLAFQLLGPVRNPLSAAIAGVLAGAVIGAAQWLALRPAVSWRWILGSTIGMSAGSALAAVATGSSTSVAALATTGLIAGACVGLAQGLAFMRGWRVAALWTATVSPAWALGWAITANVIVDADHGYIAFGSSGAVVVTVITALVLRRILGKRNHPAASPAATAGIGHAAGNQL
ncbi:hypothetical protein ACFRJ9_12940 [Paenarthrobacter sp. NPDC056912]|uniref:hypothetical protein n=1 Tax=Paenarthrobacter sp. NPDC056912 TaxID=3345965 RepID=UPI00367262DE